MEAVKLHDILGGLVALALVAGVVLLAILGRECPEQLWSGFMLAMGWLFRSGVQLQNDLRHRGRSNDDNGPEHAGGGGGQGDRGAV